MWRRFSLVLLGVILAVLPVRAQQATTSTLLEQQKEIIALGGKDSRVMAHLDHLTNKIGPRLTSSQQLQSACEWAVDQLKGWGIENARLEEWGEFPVGFSRGKMSGRMLSPEELTFELTTPSWTGGTDGPAKGSARLAPRSVEEAEAMKSDLKGSWLVEREAGGRRGPAIPRDVREALTKLYLENGALGVIRPGAATGNLVHTFGNHNITWETRPMLPQVIVRHDQWTKVKELLEAEKPVELEFDLQVKWKEGPIKLYNVIADIKGTEFPDEYVIVGGHIDSWDGATGTTDNGTGTATTLEAARLLAMSGIKPRRTIRFMLWSGEEQGLLGSWGWIGKNKDVLPRISAVLVHDGGTNYVSGILATKAMAADFAEIFAYAKDLSADMPFEVKETNALPEGIGSDHDSFLREGVPGFFWNQDGKANYNHTHHTQYDTYDAAIEAYQKHTSVVVACGALGVASLDHLLNRAGMRPRQFGVRLKDGNVVAEVSPGSKAEEIGLKIDDKIISMAGDEIKSNRELRAAMRKGLDSIAVVWMRGEEKIEATATWSEN